VRTFLDSSAFAKRFIEEPGSAEVERVCRQATELGLSVLCVPEVVSGLNRRLREKGLTPSQYAAAKNRLAEDVRDATVVMLTPSVVLSSISILEAGPVRAMDALRVACALEWGANIFASSDERQVAAAKKAGLRTLRV